MVRAAWIALAVVLGVAVVAFLVARARGLDRARCPACGQRALAARWYLATVLINGRRAPTSYAYLRCGHCQARFKQHRGQKPVSVSESEWPLEKAELDAATDEGPM